MPTFFCAAAMAYPASAGVSGTGHAGGGGLAWLVPTRALEQN
jgi:hypothetical protein